MQRSQRLDFMFIVFALAAVVAGLWLYNPMSLYFVNDDFIHIPLSKEGVLFQRKSFRPVCDLSIALDYWLWKKQALGYHVSNLLLHVANTLLVYHLAKLIFKKYTAESNHWINNFSALLFFIYPFHSESIYWILGRSASLGTLFFLLALIFYLRRNANTFYFVASLVCFSIGLMTYESVWVFPLVALFFSVLDIKSGRSFFKKEARFIIVLIVVFIGFGVLRYAVIGEVAGNYDAAAFKHFEVVTLLQNGVRLLVRSFSPPVATASSFYGYAAGLLILFTGAAFSLRKQKNNARLAWVLFACILCSYIPYLSLGIDTHGTEGERFLYLPSVFISLLVTGFIFSLNVKANQKISLIAVVFGYCFFHLFQSRKNYEAAGNVSRATISALHHISGKSRLFVDSLPEECNGAVIFRLGFAEAVRWMKPGGAFQHILVSSSMTNLGTNHSYPTLFRDSTFLVNKVGTEDYNFKTDAVFFFTDTALIVVK